MNAMSMTKVVEFFPCSTACSTVPCSRRQTIEATVAVPAATAAAAHAFSAVRAS